MNWWCLSKENSKDRNDCSLYFSENLGSKKSLPFEKVDSEVKNLLDDMLETMYAAPGIGLAAVQQKFLFRKTGWALKIQS